MNMFKKNGGFTLVELIIVIAILAILSSVAVAGYSAYITKANDSAAETFLNDLKTQITLANAKGGAVTEITVSKDGDVVATVESVSPDFEDDFAAAYGIAKNAITVDDDANTISFTVAVPSAFSSSSYKTNGAKWEDNEWTAQ